MEFPQFDSALIMSYEENKKVFSFIDRLEGNTAYQFAIDENGVRWFRLINSGEQYSEWIELTELITRLNRGTKEEPENLQTN